jgi:hypothetical protein
MVDHIRPAQPVTSGLLPLRPLTVELVGPAATGKSSLLLALAREHQLWQAGLRLPTFRHLQSAVGLAPTYLALHRPYRGLLWKEMKRITYLRTLRRVLEDPTSTRSTTVILDQGAVYMMARLLVFGKERVRSAAFDRWWQETIEHWARVLDIVVWLDAPDPILIHRIRTRKQPHPVKGLSDAAISRFITTYRAAYDRVLGGLAAAHGPAMIAVRTDQESLDQAARRVAGEIQRKEEQGS